MVVATAAAGAVAAIIAACSSSGTQTVTVQAPATVGSYSVSFPSPAMAIATSTVQILVFDASADASNLCFTLINKLGSGQDLGAAVYTGEKVATCDLFKDEQVPVNPDAGAGAGQISLPYGSYAVVARGERNSQLFMRGCALVTFSEPLSNVTVSVTPANLTANPVPPLPSTCDPNTPFTQHCDPANASKCSP